MSKFKHAAKGTGETSGQQSFAKRNLGICGKPSKDSERYFYWTSVDTNKVGAGQKIPVIISTADGKYYVSDSTTADRTGSGPSYVAISAT